MYSLYRAWLSMSQTDLSPPSTPSVVSSLALNLSAPSHINTPDVQLQVGPALTNFSAHRNVLTSHSGFFKAALNNFPSSAPGSQPVGPILVPNIAVDEFSSLLTFMYTGYLDLNLGNIYNILLATHILHMPRALELCRTFLMQTQSQQNQLECAIASTSTSTAASASTQPIIKPIACKPQLTGVDNNLISDIISPDLINRDKKIFNNSVFKLYSNQPPHETEDNVLMKEVEASTSSATNATLASESEKNMQRDNTDQRSEKSPLKKDKRRRITTSLVAQPACSLSEDKNRVIVDIACCDGPVRFHRVINKNYGRKTPVSSSSSSTTNEETCKKRTTLAAINKIMTENIKLADTNTDDKDPKENGNSSENSSSFSQTELYTCLYCNHTFKSQYCYQKHARRHLNPVDPVKIPSTESTSSNKQSTSMAGLGTKREFKLLDMNVQYYPCKTCGSKFPSYYFVHKHRKLCHADEMADGSNKNNEIVQVKPKKIARLGNIVEDENSVQSAKSEKVEIIGNHEETTGSDIIDVEDTN